MVMVGRTCDWSLAIWGAGFAKRSIITGCCLFLNIFTLTTQDTYSSIWFLIIPHLVFVTVEILIPIPRAINDDGKSAFCVKAPHD